MGHNMISNQIGFLSLYAYQNPYLITTKIQEFDSKRDYQDD